FLRCLAVAAPPRTRIHGPHSVSRFAATVRPARAASSTKESLNMSGPQNIRLPEHRDLYYGGQWHAPEGRYVDTWNPATGDCLGPCADADAADVDAAVQAAQAAFAEWSRTRPAERAALMRNVATVLREHATELALLDAANCGNPVAEMTRDALAAAAQ